MCAEAVFEGETPLKKAQFHRSTRFLARLSKLHFNFFLRKNVFFETEVTSWFSDFEQKALESWQKYLMRLSTLHSMCP